jgi:hypothetical protein
MNLREAIEFTNEWYPCSPEADWALNAFMEAVERVEALCKREGATNLVAVDEVLAELYGLEEDIDDRPQVNSDDLVVRAIPWDRQRVIDNWSGIELTHCPTGIVVLATAERSKIQNQVTALDKLRTALAAVTNP